MSQNDFNIANQSFPAFRADLNSALQALASNSSGATEPSTTYAYQWWYDTSINALKMRNESNDGWITVAEFDQTAGAWLIVAKTALAGSAALPVGTTAERDAAPSAGFIRFNSTEGSFEGYDGSQWGSIGGGAVDDLFYENAQEVVQNYTIPGSRNAMTTGPIDILAGVTVTVSTGARWVII